MCLPWKFETNLQSSIFHVYFQVHKYKGLSKDQIFSQMNQAKEKDVKWKDGKVWCLVFSAGDEIADLIKEAYTMFFSENGCLDGRHPHRAHNPRVDPEHYRSSYNSRHLTCGHQHLLYPDVPWCDDL